MDGDLIAASQDIRAAWADLGVPAGKEADVRDAWGGSQSRVRDDTIERLVEARDIAVFTVQPL
jgi:hypothetical protein